MTASIEDVRKYWEWYIDNTPVPGEACGSPGYFAAIQVDHQKAYSRANELLDLSRLEGRSLLELGCGIGLDTVEFARHGAQVTAIDVSERALDLARRNVEYSGSTATFELGDAEQLRFDRDSFDFVVCRGLLMFTPDDRRVVDEIHRVLKPGGEAQLLLHNRRSWYAALAQVSGSNRVHEGGGPPIDRLYTLREATELVGAFASHRVVFDRFPTATKRGGGLARVFNGIVLPLTGLIPRSILRPFGYYMIVMAVK